MPESAMSFTSAHLFFDDLEIGGQWDSLGRTVTETDIVNFAGISGDFNPIHINHHYASTTPFRKPIAHGMLILSIASGLGLHSPPVRTLAILAIREWHFRDPVFPGDTIRMRGRVLEKQSRGRGRRGEVVWARTILNQEEKIVQEGVLVTLVEARGSAMKEKPVVSASDED
jgi:3-hydroxybutyryl-CoA dehydratase